MTVSQYQCAPNEGLLKPNVVEVLDKPDFIAVSFDTELDSVIFLPNSGDVLLSSKSSLGDLFAKESPDHSQPLELENVLKHLGIETR